MNQDLSESLKSHSIPNPNKLIFGKYDNDIFKFLEDRYKIIESELNSLKKQLNLYQSI